MTVEEKIIDGMKHVYIKYTDEEKAEMVEKAKKVKASLAAFENADVAIYDLSK